MTTHRAGTVSIAILAGLTLTLGGVYHIAPDLAKHWGLDLWNLPALRGELTTNSERGVILEENRIRIIREIEFSNHLGRLLVEGQITLEQATDDLEPTLRERDGFDITWQTIYAAPTFRHGVARYAIQHAQQVLELEPERWATVSPRLEAQYVALK